MKHNLEACSNHLQPIIGAWYPQEGKLVESLYYLHPLVFGVLGATQLLRPSGSLAQNGFDMAYNPSFFVYIPSGYD